MHVLLLTAAVSGDVSGEVGGDKKSSRSRDAAKYWALVDKNRQDFQSWTHLISVVDKEVVITTLTVTVVRQWAPKVYNDSSSGLLLLLQKVIW